ncbi:MAG: hypothetical protein AAGK14_01635 [Verrucomicrobiota bacterium]
MSNRLASISSSPVIREFAQGAAQHAIQPVAEFLAPTVPVATSIGKYKIYDEKNRFHLPDTFRGIGGRATELSFDVSDATYNCQPHALDYPIDHLEALEQAGIENALQEGATMIAEVAALAHEKSVIDAALAAAGLGDDLDWTGSSATDPVDDLDAKILDVIKAAKYGSLMGVGVLFGASAWKLFKNASPVIDRFTVGHTAAESAVAVPTEADAGTLFVGRPQVRASYMVADAAAEGLPEDVSFLLDSTVLVFARMEQPTRRDPSFMKTFRLMNQYMVPGSYLREDGRVEVAKFDWSEDVKVTNSSAIARLNVS